PQPGSFPRRGAGDVPAEQLDRPGRGRELARDEGEEGRLPGAVRAEDRAPPPRQHVGAAVVARADAAEAPADPPETEDRLGAVGLGGGGRCAWNGHQRLTSGSISLLRPAGSTTAGRPSRTSG